MGAGSLTDAQPLGFNLHKNSVASQVDIETGFSSVSGAALRSLTILETNDDYGGGPELIASVEFLSIDGFEILFDIDDPLY